LKSPLLPTKLPPTPAQVTAPEGVKSIVPVFPSLLSLIVYGPLADSVHPVRNESVPPSGRLPSWNESPRSIFCQDTLINMLAADHDLKFLPTDSPEDAASLGSRRGIAFDHRRSAGKLVQLRQEN
jgi:hypothetical protein